MALFKFEGRWVFVEQCADHTAESLRAFRINPQTFHTSLATLPKSSLQALANDLGVFYKEKTTSTMLAKDVANAVLIEMVNLQHTQPSAAVADPVPSAPASTTTADHVVDPAPAPTPVVVPVAKPKPKAKAKASAAAEVSPLDPETLEFLQQADVNASLMK